MTTSTGVTCNTIASKSIAAAATLAPDPAHADGAAHQPGYEADLARSFVMRRMAPALAKLEVRSTRLAGKAACSTLKALGGALTTLGAVCSTAAASVNAHNRPAGTEDRE